MVDFFVSVVAGVGIFFILGWMIFGCIVLSIVLFQTIMTGWEEL